METTTHRDMVIQWAWPFYGILPPTHHPCPVKLTTPYLDLVERDLRVVGEAARDEVLLLFSEIVGCRVVNDVIALVEVIHSLKIKKLKN